MSDKSAIEWCDATFNPWWGCERVSPGCAHCYADTFSRRLGMDDLWANRGEHGFRFFGDKHWHEPFRWARTLPAKLGRRPRVFCASMADVFEAHDALIDPRRRLFDLIAATPELDWLLLTKRPEFARDLLASWYVEGTGTWPADNIWFGVSIENSRYTWRADVLREIPAAVRFISAEPLLGSLFADDGRPHDWAATRNAVHDAFHRKRPLELDGIDWLIAGGESGPGFRPVQGDWVRQLRDACAAAGTAFFFKQWGGRTPKDGGRELDGRVHDEWPAGPR